MAELPVPGKPDPDSPFSTPVISPADHWAALASLRRSEHPLGRGLPESIEELHGLVQGMCRTVQGQGGAWLLGAALAERLGLPSTRAVRALLAYARVAYRITEIVGLPGSGYAWGPANPEAYTVMAGHARRMGRDWFFLGALYGEGDAAENMAQMLLDFASSAHQRAALAVAGAKGPWLFDPAAPGAPAAAQDELDRLGAVQGLTMGAVLDRMFEFMRAHPAVYGADLRRFGEKHAAHLVPAASIADLLARVDDFKSKVQDMLRSPDLAKR